MDCDWSLNVKQGRGVGEGGGEGVEFRETRPSG